MSKPSIYIVLLLSMTVFSKAAIADIEPINVVVENVVSRVEEGKKMYYDAADVVNKTRAAINTGRDKIQNVMNKIKDFIEDPIGVLKTVVMDALQSDDPEQTDNESLEATKQAYSRTRGMQDNIAAQKALNEVVNEEKFKNISILFARSILKRQELKKEESEEPDLSTLAAAQKAATQQMITSSKRWNDILMTQAYIHSFEYTLEIQNYQNDEETEE